MANYSIWVLSESSISFDDNTVLDDGQSDGSALLDAYMTINATNATQLNINDVGSETNFADNEHGQRLDGTQTFNGETFADGTRVVAEYTFYLLDEATGIEYQVISINVLESQPSTITIEGLAFVGTPPPVGVALKVVGASEGPKNGGPNAISFEELTPICFANGTLIDTPLGPRKIEDLKQGDVVLRADGSPLMLRRAFARAVTRGDMQANPKLRPIRIEAGALGCGLPRRPLRVSRQHRLLVASKIAERMFGEREVLLPANKMTDLPGIDVDDAPDGLMYHHLLFDTHEVIFAEGAPAESLYTGKAALGSISAQARLEVLSLYPRLSNPEHTPPTARLFPSRKQQKQLMMRHAKNGKPVLSDYAPLDVGVTQAC